VVFKAHFCLIVLTMRLFYGIIKSVKVPKNLAFAVLFFGFYKLFYKSQTVLSFSGRTFV
jgi:hypothetical protein